jgi:hypothetical protein
VRGALTREEQVPEGRQEQLRTPFQG